MLAGILQLYGKYTEQIILIYVTILIRLDSLELATFSASISNLNVGLVWETATEVNNYGFEILRSAQNDNHSGLAVGTEKDTDEESWDKVAFVQGHGNSNSPKYYSFTDKSIQASGKYYYRLKQIDIDGTFEYSDHVEVNLGSPNNFNLFKIIQIRLIQVRLLNIEFR